MVDCNNFFVSCERAFNPKLKNVPVGVLSNNDGCFVARSNELKALGVTMGAPLFKCKDIVEKNNVQVFSSNFQLYGDMSHRVMSTLEEFSPKIEVYSIDEAFIDLTDLGIKDLYSYGKKIKEKVYKWTGIPVSVGIASTKTLAKAAAKLAKKLPELDGVVDIMNVDNVDDLLKKVDIGDVWGVGRKYAVYLKMRNINTAYDMKYAEKNWIKQRMTIQGERTFLELNNVSCFTSVSEPQAKKSIASTRSFGRYITSLVELEQAVSSYVANAAMKLRKQNSATNFVQVFITTNYHSKNVKQYSNAITIKLPKPSFFTPELIRYALCGLRKIYKFGYQYKKAGVIFFGIQPDDLIQLNMFESDDPEIRQRKKYLMSVVDKINSKWGWNTLKYGIQGTVPKWWMNQTKKSKAFTTKFDELLKVK